MIFQHRPPPPALADFVAMFWYCKGIVPAHRRDTIVASGDMALLVNLVADELVWYTGENYETRNTLKGIGLGGTHSGHFAIDAGQPEIMGVQFKPGGAYPFFGPSAREFADGHVALEDIWGADAERLHQRLVQAPDPDSKFDILDRAIDRRRAAGDRARSRGRVRARSFRARTAHGHGWGHGERRGRQSQAIYPPLYGRGGTEPQTVSPHPTI